jgi:putative phosphoribosyl transferase
VSRFPDRKGAGELLAERLLPLRGGRAVVLGLPRGGVPVAVPVAAALGAALDVVVVRKLGAPGKEEYAIGAVGEAGGRYIDERAVRLLHLPAEDLAAIEEREREELARRVRRYRGERPAPDLTGRTAVVVDDGVATGSTAIVACRAARAFGAARVVLGTPVAPAAWEWTLAGEADELVAVFTPTDFVAVGQWYTDFRQITDEEVLAALGRG